MAAGVFADPSRLAKGKCGCTLREAERECGRFAAEKTNTHSKTHLANAVDVLANVLTEDLCGDSLGPTPPNRPADMSPYSLTNSVWCARISSGVLAPEWVCMAARNDNVLRHSAFSSSVVDVDSPLCTLQWFPNPKLAALHEELTMRAMRMSFSHLREFAQTPDGNHVEDRTWIRQHARRALRHMHKIMPYSDGRVLISGVTHNNHLDVILQTLKLTLETPRSIAATFVVDWATRIFDEFPVHDLHWHLEAACLERRCVFAGITVEMTTAPRKPPALVVRSHECVLIVGGDGSVIFSGAGFPEEVYKWGVDIMTRIIHPLARYIKVTGDMTELVAAMQA